MQNRRMHSPFTEFLIAFVTRMDAAIARRGCRGMAYGFRAKLPTPGGGQDDLQIHFINFEQQVGSAIDADELTQLADLAKSYGLRLTPGSLSGTYAVTLRTQPAPVIQRQAGLRTEDMLRPADPRDAWKDDDELTRSEAAARLGTTVRYLRTLTETGKIGVRRISRKVQRYVWGGLKADWAKLGKG